MKNIHILPTDKPSELYINMQGVLSKSNSLLLRLKSRHIYITSDEEIKEGNAYLTKNGEICKSHNGSKILLFNTDKKIILTTDVDLIKNGVQAIDDEFLEWFVKNPSCERIEVIITNEINILVNYHKPYYKIIIPKEEIKQENLSWDELIREAGSEEQLIKILKLPHIAPLVREAMKNECKK